MSQSLFLKSFVQRMAFLQLILQALQVVDLVRFGAAHVIGKYERDEMQPSIEAARKIAKLVNTTVGYLLGETEQGNILKDPDMLKRLNEIEKMEKEDKNHILYTIDGLIRSVKLRNIAAL
jgi:transcriptional regulator with XRE-family HTH domain